MKPARRAAIMAGSVVLAGVAALAIAQPAPTVPLPPPRPPLPATAKAPVPTPSHDALAKLVARTDAVSKEVSKIRGLPLKHAIPNEVVDRDELRRRLVAMAAEDKTRTQTAAEGLALARWGMIPRATDYTALLLDLLSEQIAGYYDPETKKLTISKNAGDDPQWAELVLAHEIDHALQDQAFDLRKFEDLPEGEDDALTARRALVEGDGIALMLEVMLSRNNLPVPWSNPQISKSIEKAMGAPGNGETLDKAPLAIREALIFPYRAGFTFVAALRRRQPWSAVDAAFAKPPQSTEQVMHPDRYLAGDEPVQVVIDPLPVLRGYSRAHHTVWGELGFQLFLRSHGIDVATATTAAAGWGGDRTIVLARDADRRPHQAVGVSRSEWDTEADALEAHEAAVKALDKGVGAVVEHALTRTRWLGIEGTLSWVERKGTSIVIVIGAPVWAATTLATDIWTQSRIVVKATASPKPPKSSKSP
ncbi:MAG: hypothetical protein H0T89_34590 [Deltaproteobacteria bacterium]|nr:hypothetical protein [Deltaproteobacteria bacterium]MDQ3296014.1 hypothetical protein [Myxococcota bacterium]